MAGTAANPQKRILADAAMTSGNALPSNTTKKRKVEDAENVTPLNVPPRSSSSSVKKGFGSSQPQKSQFEEVLEKFSQDISELKDKNSEKDQQWDRPPLDGFNPETDNICFQQIDAEEGIFMGKPTVRLFGVTEVRLVIVTLTW